MTERWEPTHGDTLPWDKLVIVARNGYCGQPPYKEFVQEDGKWVSQELNPEFFGRDVNLLIWSASEGPADLITLEVKEKLMRRPGYREFQRKVLPGKQGNC